MKNVEPTIFLIAKTKVDHDEARRWLDHLGAQEYKLDLSDTEAETLVKLAGKRCYMSFAPGLNPNVTKIREATLEYIDNILRTGHGSVLEHSWFTFGIEGVSRVLTAELNRHRAGTSISEGSLRYIRFDDIPWWIPLSMRDEPDDDEVTTERKRETREVFAEMFRMQEQGYRKLEAIWDLTGVNANSKAFSVKKKLTSMFRRIVGMGVATGGVWSMNVRAARHIMTMRCDEAAEEEINLLGEMLLLRMMEEEPILFGDFYKIRERYHAPRYHKV